MNKESEFDFETTFPPLGHPEHHFNKYPNHPWLKKGEKIRDAINLIESMNRYTSAVINDDLTVSFINDESTSINERFFKKYNGYLPIQIRSIKGSFSADHAGLKSFIGTPYIAKHMSLHGNMINSFVGLSGNVKNVYLNGNGFKNFKGMPNLKDSGLYLSGNPIESWEGFTNCDKLWWWEVPKLSDDGYKLLLNAPDEINKIVMCIKEKDSRIEFNERDDSGIYPVNMKWLRDYQKSKNILNTLNGGFKSEDTNKKRKL